MRFPLSFVMLTLGNRYRVASWACGINSRSKGRKFGRNCLPMGELLNALPKVLVRLSAKGAMESSVWIPLRGSATRMPLNSLGNCARTLVNDSSAFHARSEERRVGKEG